VAIRALEIVREEKMIERAEQLGHVFRKGLEDLKSPLIQTVRGKGLLNAIVIDESKTNGHSAWDLCLLMKEKGLLVCDICFRMLDIAWLTFLCRPSPHIRTSSV
jgi:ornithine--oxo-acid transaminase